MVIITEYIAWKADDNLNKVLLWHKRFGHIGQKKLLLIKNSDALLNMDTNWDPKYLNNNLCQSCMVNKSTKLSYLPSSRTYSKPLEIVLSDVATVTDKTTCSEKYFVSFIDSYTNYCIIKVLTKKSQVFDAFKNYVSYAETQTGYRLKSFRNDKGGSMSQMIWKSIYDWVRWRDRACTWHHRDGQERHPLREKDSTLRVRGSSAKRWITLKKTEHL